MYSENLAQSSKGFCGGQYTNLGTFEDEESWRAAMLEFMNSLTYGDVGYCWYHRTDEHIFTQHATVYKHGYTRAFIRVESVGYRSYSRYYLYDADTDDKWRDYGYDFPTLVDSVEYCTRERDTAGLVYAYRIYIGALPNSGSKEITIPSEVYRIIDIQLRVHGGQIQFMSHSLSESGTPLIRTYLSGSSTIVVQTFSNMSSYHGYLLVKYRKE